MVGEVTGGVKGVPLGPNKRDTWLGGDMQTEGETVCVCVCLMVSTHGGSVMCWTDSWTAAILFWPSSVFLKTDR